jgi:hypothetical protein
LRWPSYSDLDTIEGCAEEAYEGSDSAMPARSAIATEAKSADRKIEVVVNDDQVVTVHTRKYAKRFSALVHVLLGLNQHRASIGDVAGTDS